MHQCKKKEIYCSKDSHFAHKNLVMPRIAVKLNYIYLSIDLSRFVWVSFLTCSAIAS